MDNLLSTLQQFHFLRPLWLLALPALWLLFWYARRQLQQSGSWHSLLPASLLAPLIDGEQQRQQTLPLNLLVLGLTLAILGLAGPSWQQLPQPVHQSEHALVIMLDLSPSMMAQDLKPSRLVRTRLKLLDLLAQRKEGLTALVVYAGEAHSVTPLTDDTRTIASLLPSLSPDIMPLSGSNPEMAVTTAIQLLQDAGLNRGDLLLVTDGVTDDAAKTLKQQVDSHWRLSILGVGTSEGAPIPLNNGGFAREQGNMVLAKLNQPLLQDLSQSLGGRYVNLGITDTDLNTLNRLWSARDDDDTRLVQRQFDQWADEGFWLALLCLPIALLAFRRGVIVALVPLVIFTPEPAQASLWDDLWQTPDQQGQKLLQQGDAEQAASTFSNPQWQGKSLFEAGDYAAATEKFSQGDSADAHYNRGNALARQGKLDEAIEAYQQALEQQPDMADAKANKALLEQLKQQEQQQQNQSSGQDQQQNQQQDQQQDQQNGNQQNGADNRSSSPSDGKPSDSDDQSQDGEQLSSSQNDDASSSDSSSTSDQQPAQNQSANPSAENPSEPDQNQAAGQQEPTQTDDKADDKTDQDPAEQQAEQVSQQRAEEGDEKSTDGSEEQPPLAGSAEELTPEQQKQQQEQQQALEQWLRQVPDDPGALMRRKFEYQYKQRRQQYRAGTWQPPENEANKRW